LKKSIFIRSFLTLCLACGSLFAVAGSPVKAGGATYTVTKTADTLDGLCDADCSLRDAVAATNAFGGGTISIPAGTYDLTLTGPSEDLNLTGDLDITTSGVVTIQGAGRDTTIIAGNGDRVFHFLAANSTATVSGVSIAHGRAPSNEAGGGILSLRSLELKQVTMADNRAGNGLTPLLGNGKPGGHGGAVAKTGVGFLDIQDSNFSNNYAGDGSNGINAHTGGLGGDGGAVYFEGDQDFLITQSVFSDNHAGKGGSGAFAGLTTDAQSGGWGGNGGAVSAAASTTKIFSVTNGVFDHNSAGNGGKSGNASATRPAMQGARGGYGGAVFSNMLAAVNLSEFYDNSTGSGGAGGDGDGTTCADGGNGGSGGAIASYAHLILTSSMVYDNFAKNGGTGGTGDKTCLGGQGGSGGGIAAYVTLDIDSSNILSNLAGNGTDGGDGGIGGGIIAIEGFISGSGINYNTAGDGTSPADTLNKSGGYGGSGGGIYLLGSSNKTLVITNSTIAYNRAGAGRSGPGGSGYGGSGGGIFGGSAHPQLVFSTVFQNYGGDGPDAAHDGRGGGIYNYSGVYDFRASGSIIAHNIAHEDIDCYGRLASTKGYNVIGAVTTNCAYTPQPSDTTGTISAIVDPLLSTPHASLWIPSYPLFWTPLPGSPALNKIAPGTDLDGTNCTIDQRNLARPQGTLCDIGAIERSTEMQAKTASNLVVLDPTNPIQQITITVRDKMGYRMEGVTLQISAPDSGPSALFSTEAPPVNFGAGPLTLTSDVKGVVSFYIRKNDQSGGYKLTINGLSQPLTQSVINFGKANNLLPLILK
jgi:CSLREA domain-containing protein